MPMRKTALMAWLLAQETQQWSAPPKPPRQRKNLRGYLFSGMRAMTLISKSNPASQFTPMAVQFG